MGASANIFNGMVHGSGYLLEDGIDTYNTNRALGSNPVQALAIVATTTPINPVRIGWDTFSGVSHGNDDYGRELSGHERVSGAFQLLGFTAGVLKGAGVNGPTIPRFRKVPISTSPMAKLKAKYGHMTRAQRQARIKELSMGNKVLRDAGVPRPFISEALQSFEPGTIATRIAGKSDYGLRFYGGLSKPKSPYLAPTFQGGNIRALSAVPEVNTLQFIQQWQIRPGTLILEGRIRAAFGQPGGGLQIYVPDFHNNLIKP